MTLAENVQKQIQEILSKGTANQDANLQQI
jgi:hypothetical protein